MMSFMQSSDTIKLLMVVSPPYSRGCYARDCGSKSHHRVVSSHNPRKKNQGLISWLYLLPCCAAGAKSLIGVVQLHAFAPFKGVLAEGAPLRLRRRCLGGLRLRRRKLKRQLVGIPRRLPLPCSLCRTPAEAVRLQPLPHLRRRNLGMSHLHAVELAVVAHRDAAALDGGILCRL